MAPTLVSVRSALTFLSIFGVANAGFIGNLVQDFNSRLQASVCTPVTTTIISTHTVSASAITVTRTASATPVTITNIVTITTSIQSSPSISLIATNSSSTSNTTRTSTSSSSAAAITSIGQGNTRSTNSTGNNANTTDISSSTSISTLATASATSGTVTLPYATYAATLNDSNSLYTYTNIRYAEPPTGSLRFKNPVAPTTVNTTIQDGSYGQTCYQLEQGANSAAPNQGEDCLFLDLVVPSNIPNDTLLPVLFYLYGGGYHSGQKEIYDGSPLVTASNNSIIYIVPNYRVGAFGFFGDQFGTGDVMPGLMDQVMAMEWVQQYIHLFGGNKDEVTVAGHSAGGGSLVTHLISHGGEGTLPFQKAAVMSPAVPPNFPEYITTRNEEILEYFGYENATLDEILALPASTINDFTAHHGASGWGPIVDGDYFRELPGYAFSAGRYHTSLPIISGKLSDEGHNYIPTTSPLIIDGSSDIRDMTYDTKEYMTSFFTTMGFHLSDEVVDQVWDLYPTINDTDLYYTMFGKYDHIYTEMLFSCYSYYLETSYDDVHSWYFDIAPGYHAQENPYLFLGGKGSGSTSSYAINATVSEYMKSYLVNFVMDGDVNAGGIAPTWDAYSVAKQNIELGSSNVGMIADPMTNSRCVFWETNIS